MDARLLIVAVIWAIFVRRGIHDRATDDELIRYNQRIMSNCTDIDLGIAVALGGLAILLACLGIGLLLSHPFFWR